MSKQLVVAIDIGGVIGPQLSERTNLDGTFRLNPGPAKGAFEAVRKLVVKIGASNCFILSRASSPEKIEANWAWLRHWGFFEKTGFLEDNVIIYDGDRSLKAKYVEDRWINVMVDDRIEVLAEMPAGVELVAFEPDITEMFRQRGRLQDRKITLLYGWAQFSRHFGL